MGDHSLDIKDIQACLDFAIRLIAAEDIHITTVAA